MTNNFDVMGNLVQAHVVDKQMFGNFDVDFDFKASFSNMIFDIEFFLSNPSQFFAKVAVSAVTDACLKGELAMRTSTKARDVMSQALAICYVFRDAMNSNSIAGLIAQEN